jgi:predicted chitinase
MKRITSSNLTLLAPNIREVYRQAFQNADNILASYHINDNGLRISHFMAQILHESGGLTIFKENMNYRAERIVQVWPSRFPTMADALPFAHNPEKLANKVYGRRMGNVNPGDGWKFIGRGLIQVTGRESYKKFGDKLGVDLVGNPELAISAEWCLKIACEEWKEKGCNSLADADNLNLITRRINGGLIGLSSRRDWLVKTKHIWI